MPTSTLIALLRTMVPITDTDVQLIDASFEPISTKKSETLVAYNTIARCMYFVVSGYVRVYHFEKGLEITNHLASSTIFVTAYSSFSTKKPSEEVVQTITDCVLLKITKDDLDALYRQSHSMALFGLLMADRYLVFNNQRGKDLITLSAEEKYRKLLHDEPHLIQNVPLQYIASYLGIEPQTLSRIRKKIST